MNTPKTAFIAIVGKANVGKSSILNKLLGTKIAIVSSKPQTTRTRIMGVLTTDDNIQLVFTDTPGFHKPSNKLGNLMNKRANNNTDGVDVILFLVDISKGFGKGDEFVLNRIKDKGVPVFLLLNKR